MLLMINFASMYTFISANTIFMENSSLVASLRSKDPTLSLPRSPPEPKPFIDTSFASLQEALGVLEHPLVQGALRDTQLMSAVLSNDKTAISNGVLETPSMKALLSDASLIQKIASLSVEEDNRM